MIQRIQSVWLLLAGLLALATFKLSFWSSTYKDGSSHPLYTDNSDSLLIYIVIILLIILSLGTIFLFKQRPMQSRLCLLGIALSIGLLVLEDLQVDTAKAGANYSGGSWMPGIALPLLIIIALILAMRGIRKDRKLVKSLDRLR
jgi:hypothetical protein